jgi:hypothetical protein
MVLIPTLTASRSDRLVVVYQLPLCSFSIRPASLGNALDEARRQ